VVITRESASLDQAAGGVVVAKTVEARDSAVGLVLAREFHGEGVRILMGPRAAFALGAGVGFGLAVVTAWRRRSRG
jgi:hypothetical protein